jgi:hypothetical protein
MKAKLPIAIILLLIVSLSTHAQSTYNQLFNENVYYSQFIPVEVKPIDGIEKISMTITDLNDKTTLYVKTYDQKLRIIANEKSNKKGELVPLYKYSYADTSKNAAEINVYTKSGELDYCLIYNRTKTGKLQEYRKIDSNNEILEKSTWQYDEKDRLLQSIKYEKGGVDIKNTWIYEYEPDGTKIIKVTLTDSNNKISHVWTYDCNEEGTELVKEKDHTQICNWKKVDSTYYITVYQTFDEKGKIRKYVSKFAVADSSIMESITYDEKDIMLFRTTYDGDFSKYLCYESFKKGKLKYKSVRTYNGDLLLTSESYSQKGLNSKQENVYNDSNLLISQKKTNKNGKIYSTVKVEYGYR